MAKTIVVEDGGFVSIEHFADIIDINKVVYYSVKPRKDRSIIIKFYDKKKKLVKPHGSK